MKRLRENLMKVSAADGLETEELIQVTKYYMTLTICEIILHLWQVTGLLSVLSTDRIQLKAGGLFNIGIYLISAVRRKQHFILLKVVLILLIYSFFYYFSG